MTGVNLLPEKRLRAFNADDLELVVQWWLYETVRARYTHVIPYGGTGDKGRDVAGFFGPIGQDPWDNYQCKQYDTRLGPADVAKEICKVVFYASRGEYTTPRRYVFVAPKGISSQALDLIGDHDKLRARLMLKWNTYAAVLCQLDAIKGVLRTCEFPEFSAVSAGEIVQDLRDSPSYPYFFGGGLTKPRPADQVPPHEIDSKEIPYVGELLLAYDDHSDTPIASAEAAFANDVYGEDLRASRRDFYCAESLREFSKDAFPEPAIFDELQTQVHEGVRFTVTRDHPTGFDRSLAVREHATTVQLSDHPLAGDVTPADRSGICHQLVNDGKIRWVR